jgi:hypothetical protein
MSDEDLLALARNTKAIHNNESNGASDSADIVNPTSGAEGSMQVMKGTQKDPGFGVRPSDGTPEDTARAGRDYYAAMNLRYKDPIHAAVAYNWGPGKADTWLKNGAKLSDLPDETLKYIAKMHQQGAGGSVAAPQAAPEAPAVPTPQKAAPAAPAAPKEAPQVPNAGLKAPAEPAVAPEEGWGDKIKRWGDNADAFLLDNTKKAIAQPGKFIDDTVRSVANTVTLGAADRLAAKADEKILGKGNFSDNYKAEQKKTADQNPLATGIGTIAGSVVPIGAATAPLRAINASTKAARYAKTVGTGAVLGGAQGALTADEGDELEGGAKGAALGAAVSGVAAPVVRALTSGATKTAQNVQAFLKKHGNDSEAAVQQAENQIALKGVRDRVTNEADGEIAKKEVRQLTQSRKDAIQAQVDKLPDTPDGQAAKAAMARYKNGFVDDKSLVDLESNGPLSKSVADNIRQHQRMEALTSAAATNSRGREALGAGVQAGGAALGASIGGLTGGGPVGIGLGAYLGNRLGNTLKDRVLGNGTMMQRGIRNLTGKKEIDTAQAVLDKFGPSSATKGLDTLTNAIKADVTNKTQAAAQKARQSATASNLANSLKTRQANSAATRAEQSAAQAEAETLASKAQQAQEARAAASTKNLDNSIATRQAAAADTRNATRSAASDLAAQAKAAQQARAAATSKNLSNSVETRQAQAADRTGARMGAQGTATAEDAARTADRAARVEQYVAERSANSKAARVAAEARAENEAHALAGSKIASGDWSGANMQKPVLETLRSHTGAKSVEELKSTLQSLAASHPELAQHIGQLTTTGSKAIPEKAYYHIQDALKGAHGAAPVAPMAEGALSAGSKVYNPIAYQENVRQAGNAVDSALKAAPNDSLKSLVQEIAQTRGREARKAILAARMKAASPEEQEFLKNHVQPMTKHGLK